jgi:hypothetical protein
MQIEIRAAHQHLRLASRAGAFSAAGVDKASVDLGPGCIRTSGTSGAARNDHQTLGLDDFASHFAPPSSCRMTAHFA